MTFCQQIQKTIDFIEAHLFEELDHQMLAERAHMSMASFYRYFNALTGFTCKGYVRKRRLAEALALVDRGEMSLLEIALVSGYGSHEAFTRAFKSEFGCTPKKYRLGSTQFYGIQPKLIVEESYMGLVIKELPELTVAKYRVLSSSPEQDAWQHMKQWGEQKGLFQKPYRCFGVNRPGPDEMEALRTEFPDLARQFSQGEYGYEVFVAYDLSLKLKSEANGRGVKISKLEAGKFAVYGIGSGCTESDIGRGWQEMMKLVDDAGYQPTGRWLEEHLDFDMGTSREPMRLDLYLEIES